MSPFDLALIAMVIVFYVAVLVLVWEESTGE
jgi:hypothetical protein